DVLGCPIGTVMSRLHNARKRLQALLGPMLAVLLWFGASLLGSIQTADAQPMIRFGVRVLQASNSPRPEGPGQQVPGQPYRPPSRGATPPQVGGAPVQPGPPPPAGVAPAPPQSASPGQHPAAPPTQPSGNTDPRLDRILPQLRMLFRYSDYTTLER